MATIPGGVTKQVMNSTTGGLSKALGTVGKVQGALRLYGTAKQGVQAAKTEWQTGFNPYEAILQNKSASEAIDCLAQEKLAAMKPETAAFWKRMGRSAETGLQDGVKALPLLAVPLAASVMLNRNLKGDMAPVRPTNKEIAHYVHNKAYNMTHRDDNKEAAIADLADQILKEGAVDPWLSRRTWKTTFKTMGDHLPEKAVYTLAALAPAAALTLATGRNLRGRGEKIPTRQKLYQQRKLMKKYRDEDQA